MNRINGWIFDVYADEQGLAVWVIDTAGIAHQLRDTVAPSFFVFGSHADLHAVCVMLSAAHLPVRLRRAERHDLFLRRDLTLLEVQILRPLLFTTIFARVRTFRPALTYYNADLSPAQFYYFEKRLFPLAYCEIQTNAAGWINDLEVKDSCWALEYRLPPLRTMSVRLAGQAANPTHGFRGELEIHTEDRVCVLDTSDPRELLRTLNRLLQKYDPDLLISEYGDSFILPQLIQLANRYGLPLPLNRDPKQAPLSRQAYSYASYGRIVYRSASHLLFGRWHIDLHNAFRMGDYWLDGIFELARLTGLNVQKVARTSTGTGISVIEAATAYRRKILIPYHKREAEDFKSAGDLILTDKGGLTYRPIVGLHENVAEIDFVSMYPFIMAKFNISPETINCPCCHNSVVPEIGYSICTHQRGLIPESLEPLVAKRIRYKLGAKELAAGPRQGLYRQRSQAIKGLLVTCFGYTGYKNDTYIKLLFLRSRYYSPDAARFLSKDSWQGDYTRPQSLNAWAYTEGNPVNRTDPSGHDPWWSSEDPKFGGQDFLSSLAPIPANTEFTMYDPFGDVARAVGIESDQFNVPREFVAAALNYENHREKEALGFIGRSFKMIATPCLQLVDPSHDLGYGWSIGIGNVKPGRAETAENWFLYNYDSSSQEYQVMAALSQQDYGKLFYDDVSVLYVAADLRAAMDQIYSHVGYQGPISKEGARRIIGSHNQPSAYYGGDIPAGDYGVDLLIRASQREVPLWFFPGR